ncbi:MAG: methyltransferase domain-containing protein [Acidimicrobiales bacterium]
MTDDTWDASQYERFAHERRQPFMDLMELVRVEHPDRVLDLGCGTGTLTRTLHDRLAAITTVGIDSSPAMLAEANEQAGRGLRFEPGDIADPADLGPPQGVDLVFSNAALQWIPEHEAVLTQWAALLVPGGELAVQVPANADHPSHRVIADLAGEEPWASAGDGPAPSDPVRRVLAPERYAELLHRLGFEHQHVRLQVYPHVLASTADVVEWTKGTSLTRMRSHFPPEVYEHFVAAYRHRLLDELGDHRPYFYAFKRILL